MVLVFVGCEESQSDQKLNTKLNAIQDQEQLEAASDHTDPFELNSVDLDGWDLSINVSYSGGCASHEFTVIWPEVITMIYPPQFDIWIVHDSNGDMCEAYPTETLVLDLSDNPLHLDMETLHAMQLGVVNASNPEERFLPNE